MSTTRRTFLKRGLLGGALLTVGSGSFFAFRSSDRSRAPRGALAVLDLSTFAVLAAVAERVIPAAADPIEIAHRVDAALRFLPVEGQGDVKSALGLLENGLVGLFTRRSGTPFTRLSPAERDAALDAWATSSVTLLQGAYGALRKLCLAAHYAPVEAGLEVGYAGPPIDKPDPGPIEARAPLSPPFVPSPPVDATGEAAPQEGAPP